MGIKFVVDYPAVFLTDEKILVISDLHIGVEREIYKSGIIIPSQAEKLKKIVDHLIKITKAKTLIILGDVKHEVPGMSYREMKEIPKFFEHENIEIRITIGNHDSFLKDLIPKKVRVYSSCGFKIGKYGFFHGHAWPSKELMKCDHLFMGHIHPCLEFKDKLGYRAIERVWVKGKLDEKLVKERYKIEKTGKLKTIILPALNKLLGGIALNTAFEKELIGPLLVNKFLDVNTSKAYLLDGTFLGSIKNLRF